MQDRCYISIDLKSFYASVECMDRGLDPMTTNLVVADPGRTSKTICLAVTPALKAYGLSGRSRLFEVVQTAERVNAQRQRKAPKQQLTGTSTDARVLRQFPELAMDYIVAPPRMAHYVEVSTQIYQIYLKYVAPEDIHVYSIDEVFIDATEYLKTNHMTGRAFARKMIQDVQQTTGITATAGIGTNLYLAKVAMDVGAKRIQPDENGVRIAELNEMSYREQLWTHRPITDFWRVGPGIAKRLASVGLNTMGDIARCSVGAPTDFHNEELLYRLFGVNAELLIDHAWGWEPCTISEIKAYQPENHSFSSGQVLQSPYTFDKARIVVQEMADAVALKLVELGLVTDQMILTVGYDVESLSNPRIRSQYHGPVTVDHYGRRVPKPAHGSANLSRATASSRKIREAVLEIYDSTVNPKLLIRRLTITTNHVLPESDAEISRASFAEQMDLFAEHSVQETQNDDDETMLQKERKLQEATLSIQKKFGKNALLKGISLEEGATARERNRQIGGHKA